ncbi:hypothetical protein VA7868_01783 [Vibrio aerogenes CECT 7868]|uniref:Flagellar FliJ protein n=1 Tax=Vibrio aerogenes CECT 7868 TaxID=1216006 RepID=A0A1M5YJC7_9VIBR|nr:flagellar export protein FliJ [Vibrio aerogenes]SHI12130.1 hypothetical protein VA7868_01783 [Vibrio aerogenes CECT 7868]
MDDSKLRAVGRLQQVEEKLRDRLGQQLDVMRQRQQNMQEQLEQLADLKSHSGQSARRVPLLNSALLMNLNRVDQMLQKMLSHHQQEEALMEAECHSVQKVLAHKHARVKGLEQALERWRARQNYEKARKEQKLVEDMINARCRKRDP